MPALLKRDTIRLLEASVESLHLAVSNLAAPKRTEFRQESASFAAEIGLIGSAAELAMAACIVQALGPSSLVATNGQFKTFREILSEYRSLVRLATPGSDFLTSGIGDSGEHRRKLLETIKGFAMLATGRAGGLHAGKGLVWEATVVQSDAVSELLGLLAESARIRPYLGFVPKARVATGDRLVIIEDLAQRLHLGRREEQGRILASIYVVLPDIPQEEPDWLEALDRVSISPTEQDISYLTDVLEHAIPASLRKTAQSGKATPVTVRTDDPNALPIAPQHLRRRFSTIPDQWGADIANANGRLESGIIDLPPSEAVIEVFAIGLERAGVLPQGTSLQPHESWPFIAASASFSGTPGPYWFLVRATEDYGQLKSLLKRAMLKGNGYLRRNFAELEISLQAIESGQPVTITNSVFEGLVRDIGVTETKRDKLLELVVRNRGTPRCLPEDLEDEIEEVVEHREPVGPLLAKIRDAGTEDTLLTYWISVLAQCALDVDDVPGLVSSGLRNTSVRKAIRRIDFLTHGPQVAF